MPERGRLLAASVILLLAFGCGGPRIDQRDNVFRIPVTVTFASIDPALASETYSIDTALNSFEGLVSMGEDNRVHPCLAESWETSKDGKIYTFHLRANVKFHNGKTFAASDVKRSIERACSRELAAPLASDFLDDIAGMPAFHAGTAQQINGIQIVDPRTVRITLDAPRPYFLSKLACPVATIVDCDAIKDHIHIRSVAEMAGTGPFKFESYVEGQRFAQRAFDGYWGGRPKIDAIERPVMPDEMARINAFKRGEVDMVPQIDRSDYAAMLADPQYKDEVHLFDRGTLVYLALNVRDWPDRKVRAAIAHAIDRQKIASDTMMGTVIPAKGILPPSIPGYEPNPTYRAFGPAWAKQVLVESGHANGVGLPTLHISFVMENPDMERIADAVGAQIHETLGIDIRLDRMDTATLIAKQNRRELQALVSGWFADYVDPQDFISILLTSNSPENHWFYKNPDLDRQCKEADTCLDPALRLNFYGGAEAIALSDAVLIPICYWKTPALISRRIHGIRSYAGQYLPYSTVSKDH